MMIFVKEISLKKSWDETILQLSCLPGFKLLQSAGAQAHYDIVVFRPRHVYRLTAKEELSFYIDTLKQALALVSMPSDFPFVGGLVGYFSYDLLSCVLSPIASPFESLPLADVGLYDAALLWDHKRQQLHFITPFKEQARERIDEIEACLQSSLPQWSSHVTPFQPLIRKEEYQIAFDAIKAGLMRGQIYQANLTQPYLATFEGEAFDLYRRVLAANPVPYAAYFSGDTAILSFSPERFVTIEDRHITTSPIKGTVRRADNASEDKALRISLQHSEKNRAENVMIVDLMRNDIGKIAKPGTVRVEALCAVKSFERVHHLVSDISATLKDDLHPLDAFMSVFPGGSITGAPKLEAMKVIEAVEPYRRGVYCGSLFYLSAHGRLDSNIAIRTMLARENRIHLAAGGGIVMDSELEDEYSECYVKMSAILQALGQHAPPNKD